jgi:hypothetical protein
MGFTTRVDVPLRAFVPQSGSRSRGARYETFTDLDVLGITIAPGFAVRSLIADCKTTQRGSTERMFWVRGVSDFFASDQAWMVRAGGVTAASRQLADRLGISVLEPTDLKQLEDYYPSELGLDSGPLALLFDEQKVAASMTALTSLDKKLDKLVEYRQLDYWVYDNYRNLQQVVAHLASVNKVLDPSQPMHRALFLDCAWLYCLSLAHAAQYVRAVHVSDIDAGLQQYLFGGQMALQEKRALAAVLARLAPKAATPGGSDGVLPEWFSQLRELLIRHLRRPMVINDELRYAEWAVEAQLARDRATAVDAFGPLFSPVAAKLLSDVCGFLVTVASLNPDFRDFSRMVFAQPDSAAAAAGSAQADQPALEFPISTERVTPANPSALP